MSGMISSGANVTDLSVAGSGRAVPGAPHACFRGHARRLLDPRSADIHIFDDHGLDLDKRVERKLESLYFREDIRRVSHYEIGRIIRRDGQTDRYVEDILDKVDLEAVRGAAFKILVDYNNGAAALALPRVLQEMNATVIPLSAAPAEIVVEQDSATFRAHLVEMGVIVSAVKAKLGIFIETPASAASWSMRREVRPRRGRRGRQLACGQAGDGLGPASASLAFSMIADQLNSRFVPTKITPGAVLRAAQHADTVVASDGAGGYCWPDFAVSFDAIFTTVRVLELLARTGASLGALKARIPSVAHRTAVEFCPWEVKGRVMRTMMERHLKDRVDLTDGVKVFVEDGWVLVVPDADRPEYQIIASTLDAARSDALVQEYAGLVRSVVTEMAPQAEGVVETQSNKI
jgi:mannose-1-phosphate guanylyltransferase/phosphomannomutase